MNEKRALDFMIRPEFMWRFMGSKDARFGAYWGHEPVEIEIEDEHEHEEDQGDGSWKELLQQNS
jgi:hypothetical protein